MFEKVMQHMKAVLLRSTQQRQNVFVQHFVTLNSSQNSSKGGLTREMFFNTRREISCLCAATKYPLFIPRVIKD